MRILLTNDDGITAPGLIALYQAIADLGDVHVVAPASVQSATGHAVTFDKPVPIHPRRVEFDIRGPAPGGPAPDEPGPESLMGENPDPGRVSNSKNDADDPQSVTHFEGIAVDGRPADCVKLALTHLVEPPVDLVISGMNIGANVGVNVIYSGTVAAAIEAAFIGVPAIAVSLHIGDRRKTRWHQAAQHARQAIDRILASARQENEAGQADQHPGPLARHTVLNVNIPILDDGREPAGLRVVPVSTSPILDRYDVIEEPTGQIAYQAATGFGFHHTPENSDVDALFRRYITVTPLHFDLTEHRQLDTWRRRIDSFETQQTGTQAMLDHPKRILVLCTANRCRSQMAEGWLRHFAGGRAEIASAGVKPSEVHPLAIRVMDEAGVSLEGHRSKHVSEYLGHPFDVVVTVCDSARETCPLLPGAKRTLHHSFDDPDQATGSEDEVLTVFRRVRDEIRDWSRELVEKEVGKEPDKVGR